MSEDIGATGLNGRVTVTSDNVLIERFDEESFPTSDSCRSYAQMSMVWAIGILQAELAKSLQGMDNNSCLG